VAREKLAGSWPIAYGLPTMVSGWAAKSPNMPMVAASGRPGPEQYQLDYRASDTVNTSTTVVDDLRRDGIRHVLRDQQ